MLKLNRILDFPWISRILIWISSILIKWIGFYNERLFTWIGTIGLPRRARALLTLIGSCRIYSIFQIKAGSPISILLLLRKKVLLSPIVFQRWFQIFRSNRALHLFWQKMKLKKCNVNGYLTLSATCSNWLMQLWLTNSCNKKSWIAATVVLFNTQVKTNILVSWETPSYILFSA